MKKFKILILIFTFQFYLVGMASADPSGLVLKLMKTEVSMFTYGMDKLDSFAKKETKNKWYASASYDWNANQINVTFSKLGDIPCRGEAECFSEIKKHMEEVAAYWCITKDGSSIKCGLLDLVTDNFTTNGFLIKNFYDNKSSEDAIPEIKNFVNIRGKMYKDSKIYSCWRRYTEKTIFCGMD